MQKFFWCLAAVGLIGCILANQSTETGIAGTFVTMTVSRTINGTCRPGNSTVCGSCDTMLVCDGTSTVPISQIRCPTVNPFCDNSTNACVSTSPQVCISSTFTCTGVGYYPDPTNCRTYYICTAMGGSAYKMECPLRYVYDTVNQNCRRTSLRKNCVTMTCKAPGFITHPTDNRYYGLCDLSNTTHVLKCPNAGEEFRLESMGCIFKCPREGVFLGPDPKSYYVCYYKTSSKRSLDFKRETCPETLVFNSTVGYCTNPL